MGRANEKLLVERAVGIMGKEARPLRSTPGSKTPDLLQGDCRASSRALAAHGEVRGTRMPTLGPVRATACGQGKVFQ